MFRDDFPTNYQYFLSHGALFAESIGLLVPSSNLSIRVLIGDDTNPWWGQTVNSFFAFTSAWQHVLLVYDTSDIKVYRDGALKGTISKTPTNIAPSGNLRFGEEIGGDGVPFNGRMAEWAKWDAALAAGVITALAGGASPKHYPLSRTWYWPGKTHLREVDAGITVTNNGTTLSVHPIVADPLMPPAISPALQPAIAI